MKLQLSRLTLTVLVGLLLLATACATTAPQTPAPLATEGNTPSATMEANPDPVAEADPEAVATGDTAEPSSTDSELVIYSGRSQELVGPIIERFRAESGITVNVKYGDTAELAATILEEGANSPADVYFAQDAGALGALTNAEVLSELSPEILEKVPAEYRAPEGQWVGVSGRSRVVAYNTAELTEADLPDTILDYTDPQWKGRIGWAPTNASFQAFVTAMRINLGEDVAREWLQGIQANQPKVYQNNTAVLEAVASGEISVGFINHYYLYRAVKEQGEGYGARNYFFKNGDIGGLINVAGAGILNTATHRDAADAFITFLLSEEAQTYFADETEEYPLVAGIAPDPAIPPLGSLAPPSVDLNSLQDLQGTLALLQEVGVL